MRIARKEQAQSFGIVLFGHSGDPPEIDGAFLKELYPGQPAPAGIPDKGQCLEQTAV